MKEVFNMSNNQEPKIVCKPGKNSCEVVNENPAPVAPVAKEETENVCKPGFNSCSIPVAPKAEATKDDEPKVCKPGFNECK